MGVPDTAAHARSETHEACMMASSKVFRKLPAACRGPLGDSVLLPIAPREEINLYLDWESSVQCNEHHQHMTFERNPYQPPNVDPVPSQRRVRTRPWNNLPLDRLVHRLRIPLDDLLLCLFVFAATDPRALYRSIFSSLGVLPCSSWRSQLADGQSASPIRLVRFLGAYSIF